MALQKIQTPAASTTNRTSPTTEKMNDAGCGFSRKRQPDSRRTIVTVRWKHARYIPKERKADYERLGWEITGDLDGTHHGEWSVLGIWVGGEHEVPPEPPRQS